MIKIARASDTIFITAVEKTPGQLEAQKWLDEHPEGFETWHPNPSDYTYGDLPDFYSEGSEPPPKRDVFSGLDIEWPENVGHPADFDPVFHRAGFDLHVPRYNNGRIGDARYHRSSPPPVEGALSGTHAIWPSHDDEHPWSGLNTYGPWSGGVGHYATPEEAVRAIQDDERRYVQHHQNYVAERDANFS